MRPLLPIVTHPRRAGNQSDGDRALVRSAEDEPVS